MSRDLLHPTEGPPDGFLGDWLVTIDLDWASDVMIDRTADVLIRHDVKATWFITHESPAVRRLFACPLFEIGLHPNFREGSSQGSTPREVMEFLRRLAPEARSVRTHSLVQSSPLLKLMHEDFGVLVDVSLLLLETPYLEPHEYPVSKGRRLVRIPYFWEDDDEMNRSAPCFSLDEKDYRKPGLKIFDFHPVHVALNSASLETYEGLKRHRPISECEGDDVDRFRNRTGRGTGTFFEEVVAAVRSSSGGPGSTISDVASQWILQHEGGRTR